ncbi:MAG: glycosyltransferase [Eubacterium sp.]|nr:glycosyltransferase [Eubacterium sp.]
MDPKLTIIIPVYNCENYLSICLDSIVPQLKKEIKILLIDDGSTDGSSRICDQYAENYESITVCHIKNKGVSNARNIGLSMTDTDWVMFIDADDAVCQYTLNRLMGLIRRYECTLFFGNYMASEFSPKCKASSREILLKSDELLLVTADPAGYSHILGKDTSLTLVSCWAKILSMKVIKENNLMFDTELLVSEDTFFIINYLNAMDTGKKVLVLDDPLYFYRMNIQSVTKKLGEDKYLFSRQKYIDKLIELRNHTDKKEFGQALLICALNTLLLEYYYICENGNKNYLEIFYEYLKNSEVKNMLKEGKGKKIFTGVIMNRYFFHIMVLWEKNHYTLAYFYMRCITLCRIIKKWIYFKVQL